ncbi:TPA: hypothetical protein ACS72N_004067 [Providencia alcalifaciens]
MSSYHRRGKINFTRTNKERGRVMSSDWTVSEVSENGKITITKGDESRQLDPTSALTDHTTWCVCRVIAYQSACPNLQ